MMKNVAFQLKKKATAPALMLSLAAAMLSFEASANTQINITGTIKASPCNINVPTGGLNVDLGQDIQASTLAGAGNSTDWKPFSIALTDCPATTTTAVMTLNGTPDSIENTMYANSGSAGKVQIEVQSKAGASLGNAKTLSQSVNNAGRGTTFEMQARAYSSEGGATPGSIVGTLQATFTYQ